MTGYSARHMDQLEARLDAMEQQLDHIKRTVDKAYRLFLWTMVLTVVLVVLPLIGALFAIPKLMGSYGASLQF
jgi:hypothetical protein